MLKTIGLFGGTFDPIHKGHVLSALELKQRLLLDELRLIPCHRPPHREAVGCDSHGRLAMVRRVLEFEPQLQVDEREIKRNTVSYTIDTLEQLREELGEKISLCWVMGTDAFANLGSWHRWSELLNFAHLIVITRPDAGLPKEGPVAELIEEHCNDDPEGLKISPAGLIRFESLTPYPVSATSIRETIHEIKTQDRLSENTFLQSVLAQSVLDYIDEHKLYRYQTQQEG